MGTLLVILAVALFAATALVALLHLPLDLLVVLAVLGLVGVFVVGYALRKKYVVHLDDEGYRVRLVREQGSARPRGRTWRRSWPPRHGGSTASSCA